MKEYQLEHVLRELGIRTGQKDFIIIGSQAILGEYPDAPASLVMSREVDLYPKDQTTDMAQVDLTMGEGSVFHEMYGYWIHVVGPETATLPEGWEERLWPFTTAKTNGVTGWCLETNDLAVSKLAAGRPQDIAYVKEMLKDGIAERTTLEERAKTLKHFATIAVQASLRLCLGEIQKESNTQSRGLGIG